MTLPGVLAVARPSGAAMFIGGFFDTVNGDAHAMIAKLLPDGSADPDFACQLDDEVFSLYYDEGRDRLWIGGAFTTVNGAAAPYLAVVNALTGALIAAPQCDGIVSQMVLDPFNTDDLYVAGDFTQLDGAAGTWRVGRFSLAGTSLDLTWQPATSAASRVHAVCLNGSQVILGGTFTTLNGTARAKAGTVGRTTPLVTQTFDPNFGGILPDVVSIVLDNLGDCYLAGDFATADGIASCGLNKADPNGGGSAIDAAWSPGYAPGLRKFGMLGARINGDIWAYGEATGPGSPPVVLLTGGVINGAFNVAGTVGLFVNDAKRQPTGNGIYVATQSANNLDTLSQRVFRLSATGVIDTSFAPITGGSPRQYVRCMALLGGA